MPKINLLPKAISELIAAGEVVERPASVIKELVENSMDAGADNITVEIKQGGISYIRITDNGCGIDYSDVPTAFLRHATSKIKESSDLDAIATLGFRGEALAAVSSVARVEMFTKTAKAELGAHYVIEGGEEKLLEEAGCPDGTTIIIRDIFYNTPARMKFLKKDVSEANAAAAVVDRIALSNVNIAFKFIRDGRQTLNTTGDGKHKNAVYSVMGREFAGSLIPVSGETDRVRVEGLTCKPISCKPTRNYQLVYLNGRLVRSGTVIAAAEQAYKNSAMVGKFPGFVLYISVPFDTVDVNVHPAKTEVRFSDERKIFDAVYSAVKNALNKGDTRPEVTFREPTFNPFERMKTAEYRNILMNEQTVAERAYPENLSAHKIHSENILKTSSKPGFMNNTSNASAVNNAEKKEIILENPAEIKKEAIKIKEEAPTYAEPQRVTAPIAVDIVKEKEEKLEKPEIKIIGEAFSTYIIAETGSSIFIIDKHAAHERILYNELKAAVKAEAQALLTPVAVTLSREEYSAILSGEEKLLKAGFEIEDFGNSSVRVLTVPSCLTGEDVGMLMSELAGSLMKNLSAEIERLDNIYHTVACRAAIKAGNKISLLEMKKLAERVLWSEDIMYCPHGRPVAFEIKRRELEKQFGRIQ